ncbi:hypothetical protein, partial [Nocardia abscessus]|uniref:hypothetical protein n=1 Tax=Nocardia abscessus TaxID=120957 RepID=UPI00245539E9
CLAAPRAAPARRAARGARGAPPPPPPPRRSLDQQHRAGLGFLFGLDDLRRLTDPDTVDRAGPPLGLGVVVEGLRGLTACAVGVV